MSDIPPEEIECLVEIFSSGNRVGYQKVAFRRLFAEEEFTRVRPVRFINGAQREEIFVEWVVLTFVIGDRLDSHRQRLATPKSWAPGEIFEVNLAALRYKPPGYSPEAEVQRLGRALDALDDLEV